MKHLCILLALVLGFSTSAVAAEEAPSFNLVGKQFPPVKLHFVKGAVDLTGKPAIVEFWSTWCGPCKAVVPHLNELYAKYKDRGLAVVGVSLDEDLEDVEKYGPKFGMEYPMAFDEGKKLSNALKVDIAPYALVLNKAGKIVWEGVSSALQRDVLEQILK
jgi:thiol-disulfide isomerase/thioredoxin